MKLINRISGLSLIIPGFLTLTLGQELGRRTPFNIPLTRMTLSMDEQDNRFRKVRILINGNDEYAVITKLHDTHVKNTRAGTRTTHQQESPERAFIISEFEARQIDPVVSSLIETLELFEKDLRRQRWDRILYLDAYLPRFLKRFYYLVCAARNNPNAMPRISRIPEEEYDVSLNSPKSDERIVKWQGESDYIVKLRIISKELAYQLRNWQQKELQNPKRNMAVAYSGKAEEAHELFVRMYFNIKPIPEIPTDVKF